MKQRHGYKYQTIQHNGKKSKRKRNQGDQNLVLIEEKKRILYNGIQHFSQPIWVTQSSLQSSLNIIQKVVYNEADTKNSMCQTEQDQKSDISNMTTQKLKIKKRVPEA